MAPYSAQHTHKLWVLRSIWKKSTKLNVLLHETKFFENCGFEIFSGTFWINIMFWKCHYRDTFVLVLESQLRFATGKQWFIVPNSETRVYSRKTHFRTFFSDLPIEEGDHTFEIKHVREPLVPPAEEDFGHSNFTHNFGTIFANHFLKIHYGFPKYRFSFAKHF